MKTEEQIKNEYLTELKALYERHNKKLNGSDGGLDGDFPIKEEKKITRRYLEKLKERDKDTN